MRSTALTSALAVTTLLMACACSKSQLDRRLIEAAANGNVNEVNRILAQRANINCRDASAWAATPLIWAVWENQDGTTLALLKAGADPNIVDGRGKTALFWAASSREKPTIVTALVLAGAQTDLLSNLFKSLPQDDIRRVAFEHAIIERESTTNLLQK